MGKLSAEGYRGSVEVDDTILDRCNGCRYLGSASVRFCQSDLIGIRTADGTLVEGNGMTVASGADTVSSLCEEQKACAGEAIASPEARPVYL